MLSNYTIYSVYLRTQIVAVVCSKEGSKYALTAIRNKYAGELLDFVVLEELRDVEQRTAQMRAKTLRSRVQLADSKIFNVAPGVRRAKANLQEEQ